MSKKKATTSTKRITRTMEKRFRETAEQSLISNQLCATCKDDYYTLASYGPDQNILAPERTWLYEKSFESNPNWNSEQRRISANKTVLYLNPEELKEEIEIHRNRYLSLLAQ